MQLQHTADTEITHSEHRLISGSTTRRDELIAAGLCVACTIRPVLSYSRNFCEDCLEKIEAANRRAWFRVKE
jgi:hypothetical protein